MSAISEHIHQIMFCIPFNAKFAPKLLAIVTAKEEVDKFFVRVVITKNIEL
jgi:hypothetical protein